MQLPLDIEIPDGQSWEEGDALGVDEADRLSPTGEDVDHMVKFYISGLSGITAERPVCRDDDRNRKDAAPPDQMRVIVSVFRRGEALGSSDFSDPLSLSTSRMLADDSTNRYVAMWLQGDNDNPLEFEVPIRFSNHQVLEKEEFELLVFLADNSGNSEKILAYPIGLGSFVVDDENYSSTKNVDVRIRYITSRSRFPVMEIESDPITKQLMFSRAPLSRLCSTVASTYRLDERGGGFIRMTVELRPKTPFPPLRETLCSERVRSMDTTRNEITPGDVLFDCERTSTPIICIEQPTDKVVSERTMQEASDLAMEANASTQAEATGKMVAKLKFPCRNVQDKHRTISKMNHQNKTKAAILDPDMEKSQSEKPIYQSLQYRSGSKFRKQRERNKNSGKRLVDVESASLMSFDDHSLMLQLRRGPPDASHLHTSTSRSLPFEEKYNRTNINFSRRLLATKVLKVLDSLVSIMTCGRPSQRPSDESLVESVLSWTHTWNTYEEDAQTFKTVGKSHHEETDVDAEADDEVSFLAQFTDNDTWNSGRAMPPRGKSRNRSTDNESPTFWSEVMATAQHDLCPGETGTFSSLESRKVRKSKKKKKKNRAHGV